MGNNEYENKEIQLPIFINNNGIIETKQLIIDTEQYKKFIEEIFRLYNIEGPFTEILSNQELKQKERYQRVRNHKKIDIFKQKWIIDYTINSDDDQLSEITYYIYDINSKDKYNYKAKVFEFFKHMDGTIEKQEDIISNSSLLNDLINWKFGEDSNTLYEYFLVNSFLNTIKISNNNNMSNANFILLNKLKEFIDKFNNTEMNHIVNNSDDKIERLEIVISGFLHFHFKFPKFVHTVTKPITGYIYKSKLKKKIPEKNKVYKKCEK